MTDVEVIVTAPKPGDRIEAGLRPIAGVANARWLAETVIEAVDVYDREHPPAALRAALDADIATPDDDWIDREALARDIEQRRIPQADANEYGEGWNAALTLAGNLVRGLDQTDHTARR
jgi:hypothetical protein